MSKLLDKIIKKAYHRHSKNEFGFKLPMYVKLPFNKELALYAMNMDWESLRIKITDNETYKITRVIKKGKY